MKVQSIYPEHVKAFELGLRTVETRTWSTEYRGPLALYATTRHPCSARALEDDCARHVFSELHHRDRAAHQVEGPFILADDEWVVIDDPDHADDYRPEARYGMFDQGNFGHVYANARPLATPVRIPRRQVPQGRPIDLTGSALVEVLAQVIR